MNILPQYSPWGVLRTYTHGGINYVVQCRMNKRTGLKKFKVSRMSGWMHFTGLIEGHTINALFEARKAE